MARYKVVLTDNIFPDLIMERNKLWEIGAELIEVTDPADLKGACEDADAIINTYEQMTADIIGGLRKCKMIIRNGIGVNTIDIEACSQKGIMVANIPAYCIDEVATHTMSLLLALARKVTILDSSVKGGIWDVKSAVPVYSLKNKVLGLVGFGKIPRLVCERAAPFGLKIIAFDPYVTEGAIAEAGAKKAGLDDLIVNSDYISLHCPLTPETKDLFNADAFKRMKKSAYILNTSRGPVINESDLIEALQNGEIAGAGLDVLTKDGVDTGNPLLKMGNVILTPHSAWYSEESIVRRREQTVDSVIDVLLGGEPPSWVNKKQMVR